MDMDRIYALDAYVLYLQSNFGFPSWHPGFQPAKIDESLPAVDRIRRRAERVSTLDVAGSIPVSRSFVFIDLRRLLIVRNLKMAS